MGTSNDNTHGGHDETSPLEVATLPEETTTDLNAVTVIIPALNEEESLPLVLRDLPTVGRVIVVDNASTDDTAVVARENGAIVISEPQRGYGAACLRGLVLLEELIADGEKPSEVVAFLDADYSDHPQQLPEIVGPILRNEADFVVGSRLLGEREEGSMPPQSIYGNKLACGLMWMLFGAKHTDLGPFRAISYSALKQLGMCDTNFGWTVEMQIKAARQRLRTIEVPVHYRKRIGASKISGTISGTIRAGSKILYLIAKYGFVRG
ncbi:glycosyltransferase family 2 protein [Calycomorphotria hydatis]|uniref:Undecaprenyl-phosphate mannosyltransferase n=1 Tax=Calycomorphotria hydatis TaxID=2528027 RepID=A0A517TBF6_9PLAN|nr:glycosyltransferase family 2 protein [Calycomorphotria hydatis]QDT65704.1 Undecaprenyl-phosphate mannosyltransferase [Calycomorphotria hydatis]